MAINPAQIGASLNEIVAGLPVLLQVMQIVTMVFFVLFFGSIVMFGFRAYASFWKKLGLRLLFGIFALFSGAAIRNMLPLPDSIFVNLIQLDMILAGLISSIIFAISLFLLSRALSSEKSIKKAITRLEEKLSNERSIKRPKNPAKNIWFIAGIVIMAAFLIFSAFNYTGLPNMEDNIMGTFGITQEDLESLSDLANDPNSIISTDLDLSSECLDALVVMSKHVNDFNSLLVDYNEPVLRAAMQAEAGEDIAMFKQGIIEGVDVVLGVAMSGTTCVGTGNEVCKCVQGQS